jgi:hypothetical protein
MPAFKFSLILADLTESDENNHMTEHERESLLNNIAVSSELNGVTQMVTIF